MGRNLNKGFGASALASEFGGTFVEESRSDGSMATDAYLPEVAEEEERVFGNDPLHRFVPINDVPAMNLSGQRWTQFIR